MKGIIAEMAVKMNHTEPPSAEKQLEALLEVFSRGVKEAFAASRQEDRQRIDNLSYSLDVARNAAFPAVLALVELMEGRDSVTYGHSRRIAKMAVHFAHFLKWPPERVKLMNMVALLHDVGKVIIPDSILLKEGKFTPLEYETMKLHSGTGARIIKRLEFLGEEAEGWVLSHHERWDGEGYPDGLDGKDIPVGARILCLCDAFDAMTEARRYRQKMEPWIALDEIIRCGGRQFDPDLVNPFFEAFQKPLDLE
jgi:HD-GYP domain-containing protein (c-di-GMP phosphodiesterase class II)